MRCVRWFEVPRPWRLLTIYYQAPDVGPMQGMFRRAFWTLQIDLREDSGHLFENVHKTFRNEIRRGEKEGVQSGASMNPAAAIKFYNGVAKSKGLRRLSLRRASSRDWKITVATRAGEILAVHIYLMHERRIARLLFSATADSASTGVFSGFANKSLHWWDVVYFKSQGFEIYDLGGVAHGTQDVRLQGINRFKERLGGNLVCLYHYYGALAWVLVRLREILRRVRL